MSKKERDPYVSEMITDAALSILSEGKWQTTSISELCNKAKVSRASFYRNFESKNDIFYKYIEEFLKEWKKENEGTTENNRLYASLFNTLLRHSKFLTDLREANLMYLFLNAYMKASEVDIEENNFLAYIKSFISYGTYGWIEQWIERGMVDSPESMAILLAKQER